MFGSQARGTAALGSDVDVGIVPTDRPLMVAEELAFASALSAVTGTEVDLVRLDPRLGAPRPSPIGSTSTK